MLWHVPGHYKAFSTTIGSAFQTPAHKTRLLQVVDLLFAQPILTIRQVETALGINLAAAQRYMDQLTQAGLLREITGKARNRVYRANEVLRRSTSR